jgi:CBS domain-containing protein
MLVSQILKEKGDMVFTIGPAETVAAGAALLDSRRVGAMVVVADDHSVIGIVSERDIVRILARHGAEALRQPISDCMSNQVIIASLEDRLDDLLERMTDRRIRHLPVLQAGRLAGIVSIGDLVKRKIAETEAEAAGLKAYIAAG